VKHENQYIGNALRGIIERKVSVYILNILNVVALQR